MKKLRNMKKAIVSLLLVMTMFMLQGCSLSELTTPVTTHSMSIDENNKTIFKVVMKADTDLNYKWYTYCTMEIDQNDSNISDGLFNHTHTSEYEYTVRDAGDFKYYMILVEDSNLETARIFPFNMSSDGATVTFEEMTAYNLNTDKKLMKTLSETLVLTND